MSKFCSQCGAKTVQYRHSLSKGMVEGLIKLSDAGIDFINIKELGLTRNQWDNFQKLKYWGLVEQKGAKTGHWKITLNGLNFIGGVIKIARSVWTYRGSVVSIEGPTIAISQVGKRYKQREEYADEAVEGR